MKLEFQVRTEKDMGKLYLSVSYNGVRWSSIGIQDPRKEIPAITKALTEAWFIAVDESEED